MIVTILLSAFKDIIYLILLCSNSFSVTVNAYTVKLSDFSCLTAIILIMMMFWSIVMQMWLLMQLCSVADERMHQWLMRTISVSLMTILQSLSIKRSVMMLLSSNDNEKNATIENNDVSTVI